MVKLKNKLSVVSETMETLYKVPEECHEIHRNGTLINNSILTNEMWK